MRWLAKLYLRRRNLALPAGIALLALVLVNSIIIPLVMNSRVVVYRNLVVTEKMIRNENIPFKPSHTLIFTEDAAGGYHIFINESSILRNKFAVVDMYARIIVGEAYDFTVVGYRIPVLNKFENIIAVVERNPRR